MSNAMIPWFVEDWDTDMAGQPEIVRLIEEHATVYGEGHGTDAAMFTGLGGPELIHYIGFTNVRIGKLGGDLATDRSAMEVETNFYHATDPATFTGWRRADGSIELHWTWDLRFVPADSAAHATQSGRVEDYRIVRYIAGSGTPDREVDGIQSDAWIDTTAAAGTAYEYALLSRDGASYIPFSAENLVVGTQPESRPHFWTEKDVVQEYHYLQVLEEFLEVEFSPRPVEYPVRFMADVAVDPQWATLEIYRTSTATDSVMETVSGFTFDPVDNALELTISTRVDSLAAYGGLAYRLRYDDPTAGTIYFPAERDGWRHLVWSSVNNRVLVRTWPAYYARIDGAPQTYRDAYLALTQALAGGSSPDGVVYDGVFMDSINGAIPSEWVHPYEYTGATSYRAAVSALIQHLCQQNPGFDHYANTNDLLLLDSLAGVAGFAGTMDEKWPTKPSWNRHLPEVLWKYRGHPEWRMLMEDGRSFEVNLDDREMFIASYLFARHPLAVDAAEKSLLGYGKFDGSPYPEKRLVVLPEQMFNFLDAVSDPFAQTDWSSVGTIMTAAGSDTAAANWITGNAPECWTDTESFAYRHYYVDGGGGQSYEAIAVVDMRPDNSDSAQVSLADLFGNKVAPGPGTYHRMKLGSPALLVEGGRFWTEPQEFTTDWPTEPEAAAIFFTEPVSSPTVHPAAIETIAGDPRYTSTLKVEASHWNGQPLAIEVDGTELNGDSRITMAWQAGTTYVASVRDVTAADATLALPFRAVGSDGLMLYGHLDVVVDSEHTQQFIDYSDATGQLATAITSTPLAVMPINADGGEIMDMLVAEAGAKGTYFNTYDLGSFVPDFQDDTGNRFGPWDPDHVPSGTPSCVAADFDGDGYEDFFSCSGDSARLYRLDATGVYTDVTSSLMPDLPEQVFAAAWGDYNRDGWVDLALAGMDSSQGAIYVFENELGGFGSASTNAVTIGAAASDASVPYPILWADLDPTDGGQLELIVGHQELGVPSLRVFGRSESFSVILEDYGFTDQTATVFPAGAPAHVAEPVLADLDGDGDQDLVVARKGAAPGDNLLFYENDAGHFELVDTSLWPIGPATADLTGVAVADLNPDGAPDLVTVPAGATVPRLLLSSSAAGLEFSEVATALPEGAATGGLVYDWLGGKPSLYLAKSPAGAAVDSFFYGYQPASGVSLGRSVRVRVGDTDVMNTSGIGTRVEVEWDGKHAYQWFGGGSGRGVQQPRELVFNVGHVTGSHIVVRALWPDGIVSEYPRFQSNADTVSITRSETATIVDESITTGFYMNPDLLDNWYVFEWDADRRSTPEVRLQRVDQRVVCDCTSPPTEILLTVDTPGVMIDCRQDEESNYHHKLIWTGRCCDGAKCGFEYRVRCNLNGVVTESAVKTFSTPKYCPGS